MSAWDEYRGRSSLPIITSTTSPAFFSALEEHLRGCALTRPTKTRPDLVDRYLQDSRDQVRAIIAIEKRLAAR
jgi:hypothetical protein